MDDSFDPYRKWLGIPPEEQPPHHYRLLGLELFEEDADVIVNAADARLSYLRSLAKDKHADMAERLVEQIRDVQLCLLDPAKKAFYDGQLQRRVAALKKEASAAPTPTNYAPASPPSIHDSWADLPVPPLPPSFSPPAGAMPPPSSSAVKAAIPDLKIPDFSQNSAHSPQKRLRLMAAAMLGLVAVGCVLVFLLVKLKNSGDTPSSTTVAQSTPPVEKTTKEKPTSSPGQGNSATDKPVVKSENPPENTAKNPFEEIDPSTIPPTPPSNDLAGNGGGPDLSESGIFGGGSANNPPEQPVRVIDSPDIRRNPNRNMPDPDDLKRLQQDINSEDEPSVSRRANVKRQPVPAEAARQAAEKSVRQRIAFDIASAKTAEGKLTLSDRLWSEAVAKKGDAASQYVLMLISCQLADDSGRLPHAIDRAESFADYFEVNPWDFKGQAVAKAAKAAMAMPAGQPNHAKIDGDVVLLKGFQFAEEALQAGQYDIASKAARAVIPLAKKDPIFLRELNAFTKEIERNKTRFQSVKKALDTLKDNPDDPDANTLAGRWICFENHDWEKGLAKLAKSANPEFAKTAAKDLADVPDPKVQFEIAEAWWTLAQKEEGTMKAGMLGRAAYWYDRAKPDLAEADKIKADSRLRSIAGFDAPSPSSIGIIQPGNVASKFNNPRVFSIGPKANQQATIPNAYKLFDSESRTFSWEGEAAITPLPCVWIIGLDQIYQLQQIRLHFFEANDRYFHYAVDVSADGNNYTTVLDRTIGLTYKWQTIAVRGLPVRFIRLRGFLSNKNKYFAITAIEAFCIPPKM